MDAISNLVFENKERLPSGFYLDIMNLLLKAHKQQERRPQGQSNGHNQPRPAQPRRPAHQRPSHQQRPAQPQRPAQQRPSHHQRPAHQPRRAQPPRPAHQQRETSDESWIIHMDGVLNEFSSLSHLIQTVQERRRRQRQQRRLSQATSESTRVITPCRTNGLPDMRFKCNKERYRNQVRSGSA